MGKRRRSGGQIVRRRIKNPVSPVGGPRVPLPQLRRIAKAPEVEAVLERARTPYLKKPLSEDEALNLICDAREDEPHFPLRRLLSKAQK